MKKIKFLLIPLFVILFSLILASCASEYRIFGDIDVLDTTGYNIQQDNNGVKYFKVKPGERIKFNINLDKLNPEKEIKEFQLKKGSKTTRIESGHLEIVDANIEFKVIYFEVEYLDVSVVANKEIKEILSFSKMVEGNIKQLETNDFVKSNKFITKIRKGITLVLNVDVDSSLLKGKLLKNISVNNGKIFTDFAQPINLGKINTSLQIDIHIQELTKLTPSYEAGIFERFNVKLNNKVNEIYAGETLDFDFTNVKSFYKEKATGVKVNGKTYSLVPNSNIVSVPLDINEASLQIELDIKNEELNPSRIVYEEKLNNYFTFKIKRGNEQEKYPVTNLDELKKLYHTDLVYVSTNANYRLQEEHMNAITTQIFKNTELIKEGRNIELTDYEVKINQVGEEITLRISEENLNPCLIKFDNSFLQATYRSEIKTSPVDAYPYQKITFKLIQEIPEGFILVGLFYNDKPIKKLIDNSYEFIIPEQNECEIKVNLGDDKDFVLIQIEDFYQTDNAKHSLLNNQVNDKHYVRKNTNATLKLASELYRYTKILINTEEVEINNDHYEFVANKTLVIKISETSIVPFRINVYFQVSDNFKSLLELTNINSGNNLVNIGDEIIIKPLDKTQLEITNYYINGEKQTVINGEIRIIALATLNHIEIKDNDFFELCLVNLDFSGFTNTSYLQLPQESFKKYNDKYIVRKNKNYTFLVTDPAIHFIYSYEFNGKNILVKADRFNLLFTKNDDTLKITDKNVVYIKGEFEADTTTKIDYSWLITNIDSGIDSSTLLVFDVLGEYSPSVYINNKKSCYFTKKGNARIYVSYNNIGYILDIHVNYQMDLAIKYPVSTSFKNAINYFEVGNKNAYKPIYKIIIKYYDVDNDIFASEIIEDQGIIASYITKDVNFTIINSDTGEELKINQDYIVNNEAIIFHNVFNNLKLSLADNSEQFVNIKVIEGHNAYSQREIYNLFASDDVNNLLLHRNISLTVNLTHNQTEGVHPNYGDAAAFDQTIYEPLIPHSGEPMMKNGKDSSYFYRDVKLTSKDFNFNGNGFQIEAKNTPYPSIQNIGWAINGANSVCDVNFGIFDINYSSFEIPKAFTNFKNIKLIGNTSLPDIETEASSKVPAWASGGLNGLHIRTRAHVENSIISNCTLGIYSRHAELIANSNIFDDNWSSSILFSNSVDILYEGVYKYNGFISQIKLENNDFLQSGGPALFIIDFSRGRRGDTTHQSILDAEATDPNERHNKAFNYVLNLDSPESCSSYSYDPTTYIAANNNFENYANGQSSWYTANSIPASNFIAGLTDIFRSLNTQGVQKSHINNKKEINFAILFQNPTLTNKETAGTINDLSINTHQSFDIYLQNGVGGDYLRSYRNSEYKKADIFNPLLNKGAFIGGFGYDYRKGLNEACTALGVNFSTLGTDTGEQAKYANAVGATLVNSIFANATAIPFSETPSYFSKKYFELHVAKLTIDIEMNAIPILGLFDQNVPS